MSTHSSIAMLNLDGTVHSHYCHSDGFISNNGLILYEHYQNIEKIKTLISLGDMSYLGIHVQPEESDNKALSIEDGVSKFYGRDCGESDVDTRVYSSLQEYFKSAVFYSYNYIYDEQMAGWFVIDTKNYSCHSLLQIILSSDEVKTETKEYMKRLTQSWILENNLPQKNNSESRIKI